MKLFKISAFLLSERVFWRASSRGCSCVGDCEERGSRTGGSDSYNGRNGRICGWVIALYVNEVVSVDGVEAGLGMVMSDSDNRLNGAGSSRRVQ